MKINEASLVQMAVSPSQYPCSSLKEIALAGRSNVGKSSFINALCNRKKLAYTSSKPGKTQTINFYDINKSFRLVDLPGYGYAKVSKSLRKDWAAMIDGYLSNRSNILEIILLVDARISPTSLDQEMYQWIVDNGFSGIVIATKADKLTRNQLNRQLKKIHKSLGCPEDQDILPFSTEDKGFIQETNEMLEDLLAFYNVL